MPGYHTADPNSYLVITGMGVDGIHICKKSLVWPFQRVTKISITPFDFSMTLQAMTVEKLKFSLPAVFTIGPHDDVNSLNKYAKLLTGSSDGDVAATKLTKGLGTVNTGRGVVQNIVKGIIEGETRSIVSTMTMEELFKERTIFKKKVIESVQSELEAFGLHIYNANVKELQDTPGSEYFSYLSQKAHEGALNQAKIDVADARARGEIGEAEKRARATQKIAEIDANTAVLQTEQKGQQLQADAKLKNTQIEVNNKLELERIRAVRMEEERDAKLQLEKQRATTVVAAKIARESAEEKAQATLFTAERTADAGKYQQQADADASRYQQETDAAAAAARRKVEADAENYSTIQIAEAKASATKIEADAAYYARQAEAKGVSEMAKAYHDMSAALGGASGLMQYLMLKEGLQVQLANANARAIQGLQPKIHVWTNGGDGASASDPIRNIYQNLPPLFSTLQEQTGITPPNWLVNMPQQDGGEHRGQKYGGKSFLNGT